MGDAATDSGERRSRLRQYQVQLLERMQAAQGADTTAARELGALIGARHCLLDLTQLGEIVPYQPAAAVPLTQPWYLGLANVRGNLLGVIDLAAYIGDGFGEGPGHATEDGAGAHAVHAPPAGPETRLLTFAAGMGLPCALLANRVLGLRRLADMRPDGSDAAAPGWCAGRYIDDGGQPWTRLDLAGLAREPRFLQVGLQASQPAGLAEAR
ncbi:chemotaxis protein CheW [Pseudoduganella umbonata]|uniref:Chemotaxis protein CheW n=1 Tax=Pseudoduganella umbonata TaxID=864828 RepID=A0A4P8HTG0_9BURK|nr:chemotaxis protein CheW [Pseudoduganella umbonata]MBB3220719.1 twitching motility protein PilI [Pseudoduganella umbonata]QCP11800.1 chemotaxis protein CheW [Pseudoduganella umbonata]